MTLLYNDPNQEFPTPPAGFSPEDIEHKKILKNWFAFTNTLEPELSKLTFFPKNILPYNQEVYLQAFIKEFRDHKKLDSLTPEILNSIAINVGNLFRFSSLIDKGIHKIYAQKIIDHPESILMLDKKALLDTYLQRNITENLFQFCKDENFPKDVMYFSNHMFLATSDNDYNEHYKSLFLKHSADSLRTPSIKINLKDKEKSNGELKLKLRGSNPNSHAWTVLAVLVNMLGFYLVYLILK